MSHGRQAGQFGQRGAQSRSFAQQRSLGGGGRGWAVVAVADVVTAADVAVDGVRRP